MSLFEEVEDDLWMENALKDNTEDDIFGDSLFSDDITSSSSSNKKDKKKETSLWDDEDDVVIVKKAVVKTEKPVVVQSPKKTSISSSSPKTTKTRKKSSPKQQPSEPVNSNTPQKNGKLPCKRYRVDMLAAEFGMCKCGFNKTDHRPERRNSFRQELEEQEEAATTICKEAPKNDVVIEKREKFPCNNFRVDLSAHGFGICKCGWSKEDHKPHRRNSFRDEANENKLEASKKAEEEAREKAKLEQEQLQLKEQQEKAKKRLAAAEKKLRLEKKQEAERLALQKEEEVKRQQREQRARENKIRQEQKDRMAKLSSSSSTSSSNDDETIVDLQNSLKKFKNKNLPSTIKTAINTILSYEVNVERKKKYTTAAVPKKNVQRAPVVVKKTATAVVTTPSDKSPVTTMKKRRKSSKKKCKACNNYQVDLCATEFGACKNCGMPKADHGGRRRSWSINHQSSSSEDEDNDF